jgi:tRNA-Thr(GGU) m(6)t(6)A37 methyltransferase TsaA
MDAITLRPIGTVASSMTEKTDENWGAVVSRIVLLPEYIGGLTGLQDFSHAIIVTYLHQAHYEPHRHLLRRPRGLDSMPNVGILAQRAKDRPNPLGVTTVKIVSVGKDYLEIRGLDAINGTPVLDIKPYYPHYDKIDTAKVPEWVNRLMQGYF